MKRKIGTTFKLALAIVLTPFLLAALYLLAAVIGAIIPASMDAQSIDENGENVTIYLTGTLLHTDIAIPVTPYTRKWFSYLAEVDDNGSSDGGRAGINIDGHGSSADNRFLMREQGSVLDFFVQVLLRIVLLVGVMVASFHQRLIYTFIIITSRRFIRD